MIFINDTNKIETSLEIEKKILNYNLKSQENLKNIILNYMKNFSDSTNNINLDYANHITNITENLKDSLTLCNENIANFNGFLIDLNEFNNYENNNIEDLNKKVNEFNEKYTNTNKIIMEKTIKIEDCLKTISMESELKFSPNTIEANNNLNTPLESSKTENISNSDTSSKSVFNLVQYTENTLVVSETSQNVTLPYKMSELNEILKNEPNKYSSIDEIISKKYTLPLKNFKNPTLSRFKQGFKLMREKEHSSFKQAFDLGMELIFDSNLHPAIIPACSNLEELDKYLYYLENEQTDKFDRFNIVFECPPSVKN